MLKSEELIDKVKVEIFKQLKKIFNTFLSFFIPKLFRVVCLKFKSGLKYLVSMPLRITIMLLLKKGFS